MNRFKKIVKEKINLFNYVHFWTGLGIVSFTFFILAVLFSDLNPFWKNIFSNFIITSGSIIAALIIALLLFRKDSERVNKQEQNRFKRYFPALLAETGENLAVLEQLKSNTTTTNIQFNKLSYSIIVTLLTNPITYKLTGNEFTFALRSSKKLLDSVNSFHDFLYNYFTKNNGLTEKLVLQYKQIIDNCEHKFRVLQVQNQFYINAYDVGWGITPGNSKKILDWIKNPEKVSITQLKKELVDHDNADPPTLNEIRKNLKKALKIQDQFDNQG